jgi:hypothetical protein
MTSTHPDYDAALPAWLPASVRHITDWSLQGWRDPCDRRDGKSEARVFRGRQKEKWQRVAARGSCRQRVAVVWMPRGKPVLSFRHANALFGLGLAPSTINYRSSGL